MGVFLNGFQNEDEFINYINSTGKFENFNPNIQRFLNFLFNFELNKKVIKCKSGGTREKPDMIISCGNIEKAVSLKKGSGNSVHQEPLETFINFLKNTNVSYESIRNLLIYHYGDETDDDTGKFRYSASECCSRYKEMISFANQELNKKDILTKVLDRVLFLGNIPGAKKVDCIYYGNYENGLWASTEELNSYFLNNQFEGKGIYFASLTYQVWGRNNNFNAIHPDRRYVMQIKWSNIINDLTKVRKQVF
jgi:hypothetical protein